ncbi:tax1-binding protein 1 homolog B isoform X1 [Megalops cyprinoides]|uniref:tax1-binding protein 1 homolog B isoform X1 n=1 Tax=Megalops cyprinoides TaxID=118141 RepID=UPI001864BF20|nr:tax1-binding protein 1 homolog B isoform X1 [Megalops cyprinoides]
MALFQEGTSTSSAMETSNFAHVIFQNVGKSYLPHAALECHYTLTQFIKPHQKDWVGIFKVGWSTARDYYTFLWSPFPENYAEGTTVNRAVVFQGYYVPNDDGEFYQFCYVTHKGEIRGASTPFQFRASNPTDDLLTVEDENNSDILVVTTKAGLLEQKVEVAQKEKEELMKAMSLLQKEKDELQEEKEKLQGELEQERELCSQLRKENQELQSSSRTLQEEREEVKKRHQEVAARVHQLEEDLIGVTQKGIQKETELDCLRDRVKKLTLEKDTLESQLKNERDEKELYKVHLKNRELENTKLMAELQMQKSVDVNKENMITQFKEEVGRLRTCVAEKEKLQKELLSNASPLGEMNALKEKLRQTEEQLQATRQQAAMLASELRDASSARDRSMSELHRLRVEMEALRKSQADAQAQCARMEEQLDKMKATAQQETQGGAEGGAGTEAELQREVEDLKLRLQMAAEHYKDKYKECQRLQKQVAKLSEQQGEAKKNAVAAGASAADGTVSPLSTSPELPAQGSPTSSSVALEALIQEKLKGMNKVTEKSDKYKKCKQMLSEEKERSCMFADELAKMEVKWKEQLKMNDSLKLQLAAEEDRYKSQVAEKGREVKELKENLALLMKEKEKLEEELRKGAEGQVEQGAADLSLESAQPLLLQYPLPYTQDEPPAPLVAQQSTDLQFGNPYTAPHSRDGADGEFSSDQMPRLPPAGPPSWDSNVVCIQPSRNLSRPDGLEDPEEHSNQGNDAEQPAAAAGDPRSPLLNDGRGGFCFDSSLDIQKRCPLCEVIFPPNYDQSKFEEHVESHWKVCPMCSEQFPLDCDQRLFEKHVLTHFDGNVLNFD